MKGCQLGSQQVEKWEDRWAEDLILAEDARIRQNTKTLQVTSLTSHRLHIYNKFCKISTWRGKKLLQCVSNKQRLIRKQSQTKMLEFNQFKKMTLCHTSMTGSCLQTSVQSWHYQAAEIHQFASKMSFFQIQETHSSLRSKYTEDTAVVGKKYNSNWVYRTLSSTKKADSS